MLDPDRDMGLRKLVKNYIIKYALVIFIFCWTFAFIEEFFHTRTISFEMFISSFLAMLQDKSWAHMWYMYTLIGTVFLVPILRLVTKYADKKTVDFICAVGFVFLSVIPVFQVYVKFKLGIVFPVTVIYPFYMLIGYWIDIEEYKITNKLSVSSLISCFLVLIALSVLNQCSDFSIRYAAYDSPLVLIVSVSLFSLIKNSKLNMNKVVSFIDKTSFGVYILHMFWINLIYKFFKINPFTFVNPLVGFVVLFISVSGLSIFSSFVMKRFPGLNRIV